MPRWRQEEIAVVLGWPDNSFQNPAEAWVFNKTSIKHQELISFTESSWLQKLFIVETRLVSLLSDMRFAVGCIALTVELLTDPQVVLTKLKPISSCISCSNIDTTSLKPSLSLEFYFKHYSTNFHILPEYNLLALKVSIICLIDAILILISSLKEYRCSRGFRRVMQYSSSTPKLKMLHPSKFILTSLSQLLMQSIS